MNTTKALRAALKSARKEQRAAQLRCARANEVEFKQRCAIMVREARKGKEATGLKDTPGAKLLAAAQLECREANARVEGIEKLLPARKPRKGKKKK